MNHTTWPEFFVKCGVFRVIVRFRFLFGVQVVEVAKKFIKTVIGGQMLILVAEMIFAKLAGRIPLFFQ
jgi:hypothetical protein